MSLTIRVRVGAQASASASLLSLLPCFLHPLVFSFLAVSPYGSFFSPLYIGFLFDPNDDLGPFLSRVSLAGFHFVKAKIQEAPFSTRTFHTIQNISSLFSSFLLLPPSVFLVYSECEFRASWEAEYPRISFCLFS